MNENQKDGIKAAGAAAAGAVAGAAMFEVIGGVGIAAAGTAVGVTLGPFVAIGAGVAGAGYGLYWLGKQVGRGQKPKDNPPDDDTAGAAVPKPTPPKNLPPTAGEAIP